MKMHKPTVFTDGGPWAEHDMPCAVCQARKAVLDLSFGIFLPCWTCQKHGAALTINGRRLTQRRVERFVQRRRGDVQEAQA